MTQPILRLGLVGGGPGSFIGPVHRMAACLDARFALVAGAFSRDIAKSRSQAAIWSLSPERAYDGIEAMLDGERGRDDRSEEHTSELQSLMRISYAGFCSKKKNIVTHNSTRFSNYLSCFLSWCTLKDSEYSRIN